MLISQTKRFLFIHIQKTAGSSVRASLAEALPDLSGILGTHDGVREALTHFGRARYDTFYTAAFVRNPWDRLVSWYSMIDQGREPEKRRRAIGSKRLPRLWQYVYENSTTFEEFILNCTGEIDDFDGRKSFTRQQLDYLTDGRGHPAVDFLGRFENLQADVRRLGEELGVELCVPMRSNASRHSHYSSYYTDTLAEVVGSRFSADVEAFGYTFERLAESTSAAGARDVSSRS